MVVKAVTVLSQQGVRVNGNGESDRQRTTNAPNDGATIQSRVVAQAAVDT